jgi:hypothetical protein
MLDDSIEVVGLVSTVKRKEEHECEYEFTYPERTNQRREICRRGFGFMKRKEKIFSMKLWRWKKGS